MIKNFLSRISKSDAIHFFDEGKSFSLSFFVRIISRSIIVNGFFIGISDIFFCSSSISPSIRSLQNFQFH